MKALLGQRPVHSLATLFHCLLTEGLSLYALAAWAARRFPERLALADSQARCTYAELLNGVHQRIAWLKQEHDVGKGTRVALQGRSSVGWVEALIACGRLGAETILLPSFPGPWEQSYDLLLCEESNLLSGYEGKVACWDRALPPTYVYRRERPRVGSVTILTAGTTRAARPVRHRAVPPALWRTIQGLLDQLEMVSGEPTLLPLPLCHGHGLATLTISLALGIPLYLAERATPKAIWQCLANEKIATLVTVPTILHRLLESPDAVPVPALKRIVCGSAPLSPALALECQKRLGLVLYNLYGSSEAGLMTMATPAELEKVPGTVGHPLPGVSLWLDQGAVWVRSALAPAGLATGDTGRFDTEGLLFLEGRLDDLLIIGGRNIAPQALEESILTAVPELLECAVIGVPDPELGQAVWLYGVPREETTIRILQELHNVLEEALPRTLRPVEIRFVEALPRNPVGKVLYRQLRQQATAEKPECAAREGP